jgi:hypothetical protein
MPQKQTSLADHQTELALALGQPIRNRQTFAVRLSAAQSRIAQPPLPEIDSYIGAQGELPILEKLIADHDFNSPEEHRARAGDLYISANLAELVSLLRADLASRTAGKKSAIAELAAKVGEFGSRMISALTLDDAEAARAARDEAEATAAGVESDISTAVAAIRSLELMPSLAAFNASAGTVSRVNLPTA